VAALILRVAPRHGRGLEYHRFDGGEIRIGRALDNDLILPDPFVGAEQFRIRREPEALVLEVLDRTNPLSVNGRRREEARIELSSGDELEIGHSAIAVLRADTPVAATRVMSTTLWARLGRLRPLIALAGIALTALASIAIDFFDSFEDPDWEGMIWGALFMCSIVLGWATLWAMLGRLLRHQAQFWAQLAAASLIVVLTMLVSIGAEYASYASGLDEITNAADWALNALLLVLLIDVSLRLATTLHRPLLPAFLVVALPVALLAAFEYAGEEEFAPQPEVDTLLLAPFAKLRPGMQFDDYEEKLAAVFGEAGED
jgi:hypothetical protein